MELAFRPMRGRISSGRCIDPVVETCLATTTQNITFPSAFDTRSRILKGSSLDKHAGIYCSPSRSSGEQHPSDTVEEVCYEYRLTKKS